jgi:hypothetical protein
MATQPKTDDRGGEANVKTEKQLRHRAKRALKKADRFWRLSERATDETFRELRGTQAKEQSALAAEGTRQADEMQQKAFEKIE